MYIVQDYSLAVIFCVVTMLCWGSWGNTQKLASKTWRYEFFYWDYVIGVLLFSLISGFTFGSIGTEGRSFLPDLAQAKLASLGSAFLGGIIFNATGNHLSEKADEAYEQASRTEEEVDKIVKYLNKSG